MRLSNGFWVPLRLRSHDTPLPERHPLRGVYWMTESFCGALVLTALIMTFVCKPIVVDGTSMKPGLKSGDLLLVTAAPLALHYGDVVVVSETGTELQKPIVKRVIGLPGDVINIDFNKGIVYRNGTALREPYTATPTTREEGTAFPLTVEEGTCFLMGDNRNHSLDSRSPRVGLVDQREILGYAVFPRSKLK